MLAAFIVSKRSFRMSQRGVALAAALVLVHASSAGAQEDHLSEILVRLIQSEVRLAGPPPGSVFPSHAAHFLPGEDVQLAPYLFNQAIVSQISTFPIGSSAGGFSFTFDPALGTYTRTTDTFGPSFAERAVTIGRNRWSLGLNYQHVAFKSFEGKDLDSGDIRFYLSHLQETGAFFEGDVIGTALRANISADTVAIFATYGLTDRFDLGVAVPVVHASLDATIDARVIRLATLDTGGTSGIHVFSGSDPTSAQFSSAGSATGLGDILVRAKYLAFRRASTGLAVSLDLRTPTGDEADLLGIGATQAKVLLVGSTERNRFSPHFNIGYTFSGDSDNELISVTDEFNYVVGTEFTPHPRLTLAGDLLGRQLRNSGRLVEEPRVFNWRTQAGVSGSTTFDEFALKDGSLNSVFGTIGAKYNPTRNLLISASVLFPLTDSGIRSSPVPVIGFDYSF
jgi:hypothetical protein